MAKEPKITLPYFREPGLGRGTPTPRSPRGIPNYKFPIGKPVTRPERPNKGVNIMPVYKTY